MARCVTASTGSIVYWGRMQSLWNICASILQEDAEDDYCHDDTGYYSQAAISKEQLILADAYRGRDCRTPLYLPIYYQFEDVKY